MSSIKDAQKTHQIQFNNCLVEFISKLRIILGHCEAVDLKKLVTKYYKYYRHEVKENRRIEFIEEFCGFLSKYQEEVSTCDENLFSEEEQYYPGQPIELFKGIDFKLLWKVEGLNDNSKQSIWKYLHTLYVIGNHVLKENNRQQNLRQKQKALLKNMMQSLKMEKEIAEEADRLNEEERQRDLEGQFSLDSLQELFGDNIVADIAIDVVKELKSSIVDQEFDSPMMAIKSLMSNKGGKWKQIMNNVGLKLKAKMKEKNIDEKKLYEEAMKMNDKLKKKFKNIPGMPDFQKLCENLVDSMANGVTEGSEMNQPNLEEITAQLGKTFSEMGLDSSELDEFSKNFKEMLEAGENAPSTGDEGYEGDEEDGVLENDKDLQDQLDEINNKIQ